MAAVTLNPMFSGMSGRIGNLVLYKRMGKQSVRIYVIPRNPDTEAQRKNRSSFADAVTAWQALSPGEKVLWNKKAKQKKRRGYNLFISDYINKNRDEVIKPDSAAEDYSSDITPAVCRDTDNAPLRYCYYPSPLVPVFSFTCPSDYFNYRFSGNLSGS